MNTKEMAEKVDTLCGRDAEDFTISDRVTLSVFLRNLPTVPPGYEWNGEIRSRTPGEYGLVEGKALKWCCDPGSSTFPNVPVPILRKLPPKFKPGTIVAAECGACGFIGSDGKRRQFNGLPYPGSDMRWQVASREQLVQFVRDHVHTITTCIERQMLELYGGGGEEQRHDHG